MTIKAVRIKTISNISIIHQRIPRLLTPLPILDLDTNSNPLLALISICRTRVFRPHPTIYHNQHPHPPSPAHTCILIPTHSQHFQHSLTAVWHSKLLRNQWFNTTVQHAIISPRLIRASLVPSVSAESAETVWTYWLAWDRTEEPDVRVAVFWADDSSLSCWT